MNTRIKWVTRIKMWFDTRHRLKQWCWFVGLWLSGLLVTCALAYPLKILLWYAT